MKTLRNQIERLKNKIEDPVYLAAFVFCVAIVLWIFGKLSVLLFPSMADPLFPWMVSAAMILFYAFFCSILLFKAKKLIWYWSRSLYSVIGLLVLNGVAAYLLTGISIYEAGSYAKIFIILVIAFVSFMTIVSSIRTVVEYTLQRDKKKKQKEEQNKS